MNKQVLFLSLIFMAIVSSAQDSVQGSVQDTANDTVNDYIDVEGLCNNLEPSIQHHLLAERVSCSTHQPKDTVTQKTYDIFVNRVDPTSDEVEQIQTQIAESELIKICEELNGLSTSKSTDKILSMDIATDSMKNAKRKWRLSFTFGPFISFHKKLNMRLRNSDTDVVVSDLGPVQRTSFKYYAQWRSDVRFLQFIDEPQNDFTIELSNEKMFFGIRYSHPKTLFQDIHDNPQINHHIGIKGTIGGMYVDEEDVNLNKYIHTLSTSHGNTNINLFGGKRFILAGNKDRNNLEFRVGVGAGVSMANGVSKYYRLNDNGDRELEVTEHKGIKVYGFNLTGESTLRYNFLKGKMNASINTRGLYTRIDGPMGNFRATGNLFSGQVGVSLGYTNGAYKSKSKKKIEKLIKEEEKEKKEKNRLKTKRELAGEN